MCVCVRTGSLGSARERSSPFLTGSVSCICESSLLHCVLTLYTDRLNIELLSKWLHAACIYLSEIGRHIVNVVPLLFHSCFKLAVIGVKWDCLSEHACVVGPFIKKHKVMTTWRAGHHLPDVCGPHLVCSVGHWLDQLQHFQEGRLSGLMVEY